MLDVEDKECMAYIASLHCYLHVEDHIANKNTQNLLLRGLKYHFLIIRNQYQRVSHILGC